jgi:hypothetical protein
VSDKNRPRVQAATRFFARPESFTLECPRCGQIYQIRYGQRQACWDPTISTFKCTNKTGCDKVYIIGLVAWPVSPRAWIKSIPRDQVPHPRQLAQLRKEGGGWWMPDRERQRYEPITESNLTLEPDRPERDDNAEETDPPDD